MAGKIIWYLTTLGCAVGTFVLIFVYNKIYQKYKVT